MHQLLLLASLLPLSLATPLRGVPPYPEYPRCGGFTTTPLTCEAPAVCIDDPRVKGCGMACDVPGICVEPVFCGGFAGFTCPEKGMECFDDPRDDCDPLKGGADCGGICIRVK